MAIPQLYYPFESQLNPNVLKVKEHNDNWVIRLKLKDINHLEEYYEENYTYLMARFYPNAGYEKLCIATDFIALLFLIDDQLDNPAQKNDIHKELAIKGFVERLMKIVKQEVSIYESEDHPILNALKDIWKRLILVAEEKCLISFVHEINNLFDVAIWESENLTQNRIPKSEEYIEKRRYLSAANIANNLIEFLEEITLPVYLKNDPVIQELNKLSEIVIGISNDLFSLNKERMFDHTHNLVAILEHEKELDLEKSICLAAEIHDSSVKKFIELSQHLPVCSEEESEELKRYIKALELQMIGNLEWSLNDTKRYQFTYQNSLING